MSGTIHLKNVVSISDHLTARLWRDLEQLRWDDPIRAAIEDHARTIERLCSRAGGTPSRLPPRSRNAYAWLRFISAAEVWPQHLDGLRRLQAALHGQPKPARDAEIHLIAMSSLWRIQARRVRTRPDLLRLHQGFMAAEAPFLEEFFTAWGTGDMPSLHRLGRDLSLSGGFLEVSDRLRAVAPEPESAARGQVHDLEAAFRRVNEEHFGGAMERPTLRWGSTRAKRTYGSYRFSEDRLTVSPILDAEDVPKWVLDFLVFHELLHKALGLTAKGNRRYAHTREFRTRERAHPRFRDAEIFLRDLTRRHGGL